MHRFCRSEQECSTEMLRPRTCSVIQHARFCVINNKTPGGFATSLSSLNADHSHLGGVFLSLFTSLRCQPTVHGRSTPASSGWDHISSYPQNPINGVTRPVNTSFALLRDDHVAWARFQRKISTHISPGQMSDLLSSM
jgi:hypothetical protein